MSAQTLLGWFKPNARHWPVVAMGVIACAFVRAAGAAAPESWADAARRRPPMTVAEAEAFAKRLANYVVRHHMRRDDSPHRGMVYEYFWVENAGTPRQWIQGEALDTMHDGAWLGVALARAAAVTGDRWYRELLVRELLPFYLRMLNRSDELFDPSRNDSDQPVPPGWPERLLRPEREKGFVPYWWDNGGSVSLEMLNRRDGVRRLVYPGRDELKETGNPECRLSGHSLGTSNHMAQDLALLLLAAWEVLDGADAEATRLRTEIAEAARHLQAGRARRGYPAIPAVVAAYAVANGDETARRRLPSLSWDSLNQWRSAWHQTVAEPVADRKFRIPGFADDAMYEYFVALARHGTLPEPEAVRLVFDALTLPLMYRGYCDDEPAPPGINVFDLYPFHYTNGRPEHLRSQRRGPHGRPIPIGSRMGPQTMALCGWALQAIRERAGLWEKARRKLSRAAYFPPAGAVTGEHVVAWGGVGGADAVGEAEVRRTLERELGGGLRTWEAIFDEFGYVPTGIGCSSVLPGTPFDRFSDTGGYAHLIQAAMQWIRYLRGEHDWR
ncbi:MAG: hypothetical protein N2652_11420 [Kiritimatiellae bacterium]|nr:hypothetical protein [Kiritimatiellia bacterium]